MLSTESRPYLIVGVAGSSTAGYCEGELWLADRPVGVSLAWIGGVSALLLCSLCCSQSKRCDASVFPRVLLFFGVAIGAGTLV